MKKVLTVMLLTALLTQTIACGSGGETSDSTTSASPSSSSAAESVGEYVKPDVNYKGIEFPIIVPTERASTWRLAEYNMSIEQENGETINDAIVKTVRSVEEALNVDIQLCPLKYTSVNNITNITNSIMAGDDEFKFATIMTCALPTLLAQPDMLVDLNKVSTLDLSKSWWNQNSREEFNLFGKQYAVVGDLCLNAKGAPICLLFNKQVVENLKLGNLYELVYEGKWTIDRMLEMNTAASIDVNGNTKVDVEDSFGMMCEPSSLTYFLYGSGIRFATKEGDEIKLTINSPTTISAIEKLVPAINTPGPTMLSEIYNNDYNSVFIDLFIPTFSDDRALFYANQLLVALNLRDMGSDFGILPTPKFDENQKEYYSASNTWWSDNVVIPATNTELEMTGHVLDAMGYYSKQYVTPAFIDETVIGKTLRDEDSANMVQMLFDTQVYDIGMIFNWGSLVGTVNSLATGGGNTNFASAYASAEPSATAALKTTIEKLGG